MQFTAVYMQVPEGYIAFVEELPGINSQGATLEEAKENLKEAAALVFEAHSRSERPEACGGGGGPRNRRIASWRNGRWRAEPSPRNPSFLHHHETQSVEDLSAKR